MYLILLPYLLGIVFLTAYFLGGNKLLAYVADFQSAMLLLAICGLVFVLIHYFVKEKINLFKTVRANIGVDRGTITRKSKLFIKKFFSYKAVWIAFIILFIFLSMAIKPGVFLKYEPFERIYRDYVVRSSDFDSTPSRTHPLGVSPAGQDILTNLAFLARSVIETPITAALYSIIIGIALGAMAGHFKGVIDRVLMIIVESILAFAPIMLFMLVLMVFPSKDIRIWMFAIYGGCTLAKIIRGEFFSLREREFVQQAKATGCSEFEIIFGHLLPNSLSSIILQTTNFLSQVIMYDAMLAFLGFGGSGWAQYLGNLFRSYQGYAFRRAPWAVLFSGGFLFALIISINIIGEALRGAMEVKENA
ncbi:ABC transporter permease [Alkalicella caledoniensis]|uniref:ABC transporter permease n=1 Tax=Alkalicella caledoniensis TaxID=2731377 RepID=A0A7G9W589_ALKCA|nr:ABC transporter permease [Alkalicella caledoniensis]QNO13851.1 ABC transporter permease [Alkalicella caledoniensis]